MQSFQFQIDFLAGRIGRHPDGKFRRLSNGISGEIDSSVQLGDDLYQPNGVDIIYGGSTSYTAVACG
jgi:hypothetical protein